MDSETGPVVKLEISVAVTDQFSLANQCPGQAIWSSTDQSGTERNDSSFLSRTIFSNSFWQSADSQRASSQQPRQTSFTSSATDISHGTPLLKNTLLLASHTEEPDLRSVTRAICYNDTLFLQTQGSTY